MIITSTNYWIALIVFLAILAGISYLLGKKKKNKLSGVFILLIPVVLIVNKWIFPNVYIVEKCGQVKKEIMLLPATIGPTHTSLSYGKHCYLINTGNTPLVISTIFYGNENADRSPEKVIEEALPGMTGKEYQVVALDYIFEQPDKSVSTKSDGVIKYIVTCKE